tara:strand:+ start:147 stop:362 length:216 start_codon:yes stop_codon:yes gene_type:complete
MKFTYNNEGATAMSKNSIYEGMPNLGFTSNNWQRSADYHEPANKELNSVKFKRARLTANYKQSKMPRSIKN